MYYLCNQNGCFDLWRSRINLQRRKLIGAPRQITAGLEIMNFDIAPNGDRFIFARNESKENIWQLPLDAGQAAFDHAELLLANTQATENMQVSPDGEWLVLETSYSGVKSLLLKSLTTGTERLLYQDMMAFSPAWSADSRWILFDAGGGDEADIWRIGKNARQAEKVLAAPYAEWSPTCSPDGRFLCMLSNRGGSFNLWQVELPTGRMTAITEKEAVRTRGFWSHAGDRIAFLEDSAGGSEVRLYSLADAKITTLAHLEDEITITHKLAWAANDSSLFTLTNAFQPMLEINLDGSVRPALTFKEDRFCPSSNCVFDIHRDTLFLVSVNHIADIWIAEGLQ